MITKFKLFENISTSPKIGDYVIINEVEFSFSSKVFYEFIKSNIGKIESTYISHGGTEKFYVIRFDLKIIPDLIVTMFNKDGDRSFNFSDLKFWSSNKEELEILINSKKYNI